MTALVLAVAVAVVLLIGWLWSRGDGRLRRGSGERIRPSEVALPDGAFGPVATLLLFGSPQDERTGTARDRIEAIVDGRDGIALAEVDLSARGDLAGRYAVTRTPSVFALDAAGRLRARVKGTPTTETLLAALRLATPPS